ncbi:MAG: HAD family hydrolase [Candidatus Marinimicrobia bacterium]|jgi:hypothetical protein|nr:HAD family hydrolase [Candidatus Neomarinimicrobiota bacterium]MBT3937458.1 HAD family hydrolase [Candidatus Neomarinimicrobiota bacterium]MBT3961314.1 HAD family hydrolase [Candidatus Neomarinimicrobiota bacterium]MBT4383109.1 HAD family hydrolase [Candidatus Neomarinimicrobiota bacterium]MBT4635579.1 HAD family hydrolase [Candidatus Neomarinimicrobiota bacterium]
MSVYIAMWSGPRNISTALMRSFENRPDCYVSDEPFYAHFLHKTGVNHPMKDDVIAAGNTNWDRVVHEITGPIPNGKNIWYQKHMAQHNLPGFGLQWTEKVQNCLLIRHPKKVILSYSKKYEIKSIHQLGYHQLTELYQMLHRKNGEPPIVLDSADVLSNPESVLSLFCNKLGIPFCTEMLSWPSGSRKTDGIWGQHWYNNVETSTQFQPYKVKKEVLPLNYQAIYDECMGHYQLLHTHRLR